MKQQILSAEQQILAILEGNLRSILKERLGSKFNVYNIGQYITINQGQILSYVEKNPNLAEQYFDRFSAKQVAHDWKKIWKAGNVYKVATMDHGHARDIKEFKTLAEAVAGHIVVVYGIYNE